MSFQDETDALDIITNEETEETTEESSQETLESDSHDEQDNGENPKSREWKEKLRERNKFDRERSQKLDKVEKELEFNKFLRKHPEAEEFEPDIIDFQAKNPTIGLDDAYVFVLAKKNPSLLAEITDSGKFAQSTQGKTAPLG